MARPKLNIDPIQVQKLAQMHCTIQEIADFFECSRDTISDRFSAIIDKGKSGGKINLRRMQWKAAEGGNVTMQIWLGKQYLAQSDKLDTNATLTGANGGPIEVTMTQKEKQDKLREIMAKISEVADDEA